MKKALFTAAVLCGFSFASNAATAEIKTVAVEKKAVIGRTPVKAVLPPILFEETFVCGKQGWSLPVVGYSQEEVTRVLEYYAAHLDC